jgi:hypothetical protein
MWTCNKEPVSINRRNTVFMQGVMKNKYSPLNAEARGGAVVWGTGLQAGSSQVRFPMGSLGFFID